MDDEKLTLVEHLDELRTRIIRALLYIVVGMVLGWVFFNYLYTYVSKPVIDILQQRGGEIIQIDVMEAFWLRMQASLITGLIIALPFILLELWGFIRPGLTAKERRYVKILPLTITTLFIFGVVFGYFMSKSFARWMLSPVFMMPGVELRLRLQSAPVFIAKVMLAFGLGFQLPVIILILNRLGILPLALLTRRWREAAIGIMTISAIITPTPDFVSMLLAAAPLGVLYIGTLGVISLLDRRDRKRLSKGRESELP